MTFPCRLDVFVFTCLWTGVLLSISHRKYGEPRYDIPPSIVQNPEALYCYEDSCEIGDMVTIYFKEDEPIDIQCIGNGRPNVTYKWTKDGADVDVNSSNRYKILPSSGTLQITNSSRTDHGVYQCQANNHLGTSLSKKANVVFAINEVFKTVVKPESVTGNEGLPLSLKCKQPYVIPKPIVYWTNVGKHDIDPQSARVDENERIALDYDGTLHFANIKSSDIKPRGKFICNMHSHIYRTYSEGEDKVVTVTPSLPGKMNHPVTLLYKSDENVLGLKGGTAKFMCIFGGNPTPKITWTRIDKDMNERMEVKKDGHELIINDLDISDSGYYECKGENDVTTTPSQVKFKLEIEAVPYFIKEPTDSTIGVDEDTEFPCMVEGIPQPKVEWYINGKPIDEAEPNPRRTVEKNKIVFKSVNKDDSQVLQCIATNKHGSAMADVYLNVLALKPEITSGPGATKVAEGQPVTLTCEHNGKPDPVLTWKKNSQRLLGDRYSFTHNSIYIKNATLNDDGTYICTANNRFGSDRKDGELTVRRRTEVSILPLDPVRKHGEGTQFKCSVRVDPVEKPNLKITWYKDDVELSDNDNKGNIRILDNGEYLDITKTSSKDSGNYKCLADNGVDNSAAVSVLKVEAPPETPKDFGMKTCGNLKATLVWTPGFDNFLEITSYNIYYKTNYDQEYESMLNVSGDIREQEVKLIPYANYTFKISASNVLGRSELSNMTTRCNTQAFPPGHHPKNVKIVDNQTGKLIIEWDKMPPKEHHGPGFKYVIYTTNDKTKKLNVYDVFNWETTRKEIPVNNTYEKYKVRVIAWNIKGEANEREHVYTGFSGMGEPRVVPGNFSVDPAVPVSHETIGLMWDPVDTSDAAMQGKFNGYKIRYWKEDQPEKIKEIEVPPSNRNKRQVGDNKVRATVRLPPFSSLELDVVARNTYYDSNGSNVINVTTPEGVPGEVGGLESIYRAGHFIRIKWQVPQMPNGRIIGYDVEYEEIKDLSIVSLGINNQLFQVSGEPRWNQYKDQWEMGIEGLKLNTQYRVFVSGKTKTGKGVKTYIDVKTALESVPTQPRILEAIPGKNFLNVSWEIKKADVAGYYYFVEYRKLGEQKFKNGSMERLKTWTLIKNLTEATQYEVCVVAQSGYLTSRSEKKSISTLGTVAVASAVYEATWFIIMMVVLALLLLILIIVCLVKRSRGDKYHVQEKEKLRGLENEEKKTAQYNGFNDKMATWDFDEL